MITSGICQIVLPSSISQSSTSIFQYKYECCKWQIASALKTTQKRKARSMQRSCADLVSVVITIQASPSSSFFSLFTPQRQCNAECIAHSKPRMLQTIHRRRQTKMLNLQHPNGFATSRTTHRPIKLDSFPTIVAINISFFLETGLLKHNTETHLMKLISLTLCVYTE